MAVNSKELDTATPTTEQPTPEQLTPKEIEEVAALDATGATEREPPIPLGKLIALRNRHLSYEQIGKIVGRSKTSVFRRLRHIDGLAEFQDNTVGVVESLVNRIANGVTDQKIKDADLKDSMTSIGIGIDKIATLKGKKGGNTLIINLIQESHKTLYTDNPRGAAPDRGKVIDVST